MTIVEAITEARGDISQAELARRCAMVGGGSASAWQVTLSRIGHHAISPRSETLEVIARALGRTWVLR